MFQEKYFLLNPFNVSSNSKNTIKYYEIETLTEKDKGEKWNFFNQQLGKKIRVNWNLRPAHPK